MQEDLYNVTALYSPSQVLFPGDAMSYIWLISLIMIPAISMLPVFLETTRKYSLPVLTVVIIAYTLVEEWNIRVVFSLVSIFTKIPLLGEAIATAFVLPGHFINLLAFAFLPLFSIGFLTILYYSDRLYFQVESHDSY